MSDIATGAQFPLIKLIPGSIARSRHFKHRQLPIKLIVTDYNYYTEMWEVVGVCRSADNDEVYANGLRLQM